MHNRRNGKSQTRHEDATEDRQWNMFGIHQSSLTINGFVILNLAYCTQGKAFTCTIHLSIRF